MVRSISRNHNCRGPRGVRSPFRTQLTLFGGLSIVWLGLAEPVAAQWYKDLFRRTPPTQSTEQSLTNASVDSIRRLKREARQAADRGDLVAARRSAEQAHQYALNYRNSLTEFPDCSPETTAELLRQFAYSSTVAPLESVTAREKGDELARSLTELSGDGAVTSPIKDHSKPASTLKEPRRLPEHEIASAGEGPVKKTSPGKKKKSRRPTAPRPIPLPTAPAEEAAPQEEPQFEFFQPAIQKNASGSSGFLVEEKQYGEIIPEPSVNAKSAEADAEAVPFGEFPLETPPADQPASQEDQPETASPAPEEIPSDNADIMEFGQEQGAGVELEFEADVEANRDTETEWPDWLDAGSTAVDAPADGRPAREIAEPPATIEPPVADPAASGAENSVPSESKTIDAEAIDAESEFFAAPVLEPEEPVSVEPPAAIEAEASVEMTRVTYTPSEAALPPAPRIPAPLDTEPQELAPPKDPLPAKPTVVYGEGVAVSWTVGNEAFSDPVSPQQPAAWQRLDWHSLDQEEKIAVVGGLMLLCGAVLFFAATRRSTGPV